MYCPKCSQKQISEDFRFCSRCGFQMDGVMQLLANDGVLPGKSASEAELKTSLFRRASSTLGAKIIFSSGILFVITFIFAAIVDAPEFLILPFLLFFIGMAHMIYVLIFGKKTPELKDTETAKNLNPANTQRNLPPMQSVPVSYQSPRRDEDEMIQPPSVTEPTTKLFKSEGETNDL